MSDEMKWESGPSGTVLLYQGYMMAVVGERDGKWEFTTGTLKAVAGSREEAMFAAEDHLLDRETRRLTALQTMMKKHRG